MTRKSRFKLKEMLIEQGSYPFLKGQYSETDMPAMRMVTNDLMDSYEKMGWVSRKQTNRISQDALIKGIKQKIKRRRKYAGYLFGKGGTKIDPYY